MALLAGGCQHLLAFSFNELANLTAHDPVHDRTSNALIPLMLSFCQQLNILSPKCSYWYPECDLAMRVCLPSEAGARRPSMVYASDRLLGT